MATTDWKRVGRQLESMGYPQNPAQPPAAQLSPAKPAAPQPGGVIGTANAQTAGPTGQPSAPQTQPVAASPAGNPAQNFMPGTRAVFNESAKSISDLAGQGRYAAAAGETARAALAYVPAIADDVVGGAARAVAPAAVDAGKQFLTGGGSPASAAPVSPSPVSQPTLTPATATLNSVMEMQRRREAIAGTGAGTGTGEVAAPTAQAPQGREVVPGAYAHGRGQYSDQAGGMGFSPGFTGKPNAQNDAAAEALSARSQQESTNRLAQQQYQREVADAQAINAAGTQYAPNSGLQHQWMSDLRDPRTLALRNASVGSRIFSSKGEELMANKARQARVAGVQAAIGGQMHDAQAAQTAALQSKNTLAGNLATEQMRQDGENQRSLAQMALEQQKARTAAAQWGVENRGRSLVQAMQEQIATEQDPTKRKSLVQHMRDMQGDQTADPYLVVPGGQGVTEDGKPYNMPSSVFNRQTAQFVQQPIPIRENQQAIAIRNNPNLSMEQKAEALRKLGYS